MDRLRFSVFKVPTLALRLATQRGLRVPHCKVSPETQIYKGICRLPSVWSSRSPNGPKRWWLFAALRLCIALNTNLNFLFGWPLINGRGDPCRHQVPSKGTFRDNSCSRPACQCDQFSNCVFPQDKMNTVSVRLESESDDLRSSEKEDTDLGEV